MQKKPVCLVVGAGAGIGGHVGKRFARAGYHAVLCRRSDAEGLGALVDAIEADGGSASGFLLNAVKPGTIEERVAAVEAETARSRSPSTIWAPRSATLRLPIPARKLSRWAGASPLSACFARRALFAP